MPRAVAPSGGGAGGGVGIPVEREHGPRYHAVELQPLQRSVHTAVQGLPRRGSFHCQCSSDGRRWGRASIGERTSAVHILVLSAHCDFLGFRRLLRNLRWEVFAIRGRAGKKAT